MSILQIDLPPGVAPDEARLLLALKLFETGALSLGQAAKMAGYSKGAFMELAGRRGVPVFDYPADELAHEAAV